MKNKKFRAAAAILALFVVFAILRRSTSSTQGLNYPDYTSFSTGKQGTALLYDTLNIMGYPVGRDSMFLSKGRPTNNVQIIIEPSYGYTGQSYGDNLADWLIQGGMLLYFSSGYDALTAQVISITDPDMIEVSDIGVLYQVGLGKMLLGDAQYVVNEELMKNGEAFGQPIANLMDSLDYERIYFNEAYHGYNAEQGFFESLPSGLKFMAFQLVLLTVAVILYLGKRFGRPIPYYEEIEREENEYVSTLTNLYLSTGLGQPAVEVYEEKFKKTCETYFRTAGALTFEDIHLLWKKEGLPDLDKLEYIMAADPSPNTKRGKGRREFIKIISCYRELTRRVSRFI